MEREIIRDILSGMYVASTIDSACIVDTVLQVSSEKEPLISVCINKNNFTNMQLKKHKKVVISLLSLDVDGKIIQTFGFSSSKDTDKFKEFEYIEIEGIKVIKDSLGYMLLEVEDIIDTGTHDIFIGRLKEMKRLKVGEPMSYQYYLNHKDSLIKVKTESNKTAWVCTICGYVYYGETLPDDFTCPMCGYAKEAFEKRN